MFKELSTYLVLLTPFSVSSNTIQQNMTEPVLLLRTEQIGWSIASSFATCLLFFKIHLILEYVKYYLPYNHGDPNYACSLLI